jgi:hypothetical protein
MRADDLDQRLAGLAEEGAGHARPPTPATIRRRSRRRRRRQAAGVVLVGVALAGAVVAVRSAWPAPTLPAGPPPSSPTTGAPAPGGQVVPWIAAPARPTPDHWQGPPAVPAGTPACTVGQLQATASWEGATGSLAGAVTFTSRGAAPCSLAGYPTIQLLDRHGRPLRLAGDPRSGKEAPPAVLLRPGLAARVEFAWLNWCGPNPGPLGLRVTLPRRGGALTPTVEPVTRRDLTPRCDAPAAPSRLSRGPVVAPLPPPPPDPLGSLHVRVTLPPSVVAGRPLRYTVTLANPTTTAVSLRDCPSYQERISLTHGGAAGERHLLNCGPVAAVGPGQQVVFAMILDLPATLRPGKGVLVWQLLRQAPVGTKMPVTVIGP